MNTSTKTCKKCWNLRNIRLILEKENINKRDYIDHNLIERENIFDLLPEKECLIK